jgi:hypothetical protein
MTDPTQTIAQAEAMVGPIRELLNVNGMTNSQALLALAASFESVLASTQGQQASPEMRDAIHDTFRQLCEAASVNIVMEAASGFLVDATRSVILVTEQQPPPQ